MISTTLIFALFVSFTFEKYTDITNDRDIFEKWLRYLEIHKLSFNREEYITRLGIFKDNLIYIEEVNSQNKSYELGITRFTHMTNTEYREYLLMSGPFDNQLNFNFYEHFPNSKIHDIDYRELGAVTNVKDQEQCGSCWAFSAIGCIESQNLLKTNLSKIFSEQQLVDCSNSYGNYGCDGGWMNNAFNYIKDHGIENSTIYPYNGIDQECSSKKKYSELWVDKIYNVRYKNETALSLVLINHGPISVAIDAGQEDFQFYKKGIYKNSKCSQNKLNHGVLLVGIGSSPIPYYIVKNSWGTYWGNNGYIYMARNANNMCGIATHASFATVKYTHN